VILYSLSTNRLIGFQGSARSTIPTLSTPQVLENFESNNIEESSGELRRLRPKARQPKGAGGRLRLEHADVNLRNRGGRGRGWSAPEPRGFPAVGGSSRSHSRPTGRFRSVVCIEPARRFRSRSPAIEFRMIAASNYAQPPRCRPLTNGLFRTVAFIKVGDHRVCATAGIILLVVDGVIIRDRDPRQK